MNKKSEINKLWDFCYSIWIVLHRELSRTSRPPSWHGKSARAFRVPRPRLAIISTGPVPWKHCALMQETTLVNILFRLPQDTRKTAGSTKPGDRGCNCSTARSDVIPILRVCDQQRRSKARDRHSGMDYPEILAAARAGEDKTSEALTASSSSTLASIAYPSKGRGRGQPYC